jgi:hypothetical protein
LAKQQSLETDAPDVNADSTKMTILILELDACSWKTADDFRSALKAAIGAPQWHGDVVGAFLDSIFGGGMNALKPPYVIKVVNTVHLAPELQEMIRNLSSAMEDTRMRRLARTGEDVAASLEIAN